MKKIFLPLLALVGMVTGFTLTSCGGGGGGDHMAGSVISAQSGVTYSMVFDSKFEGSKTAYYVTFRSPERESAPVTVNITHMPENYEGKNGDVKALVGMEGTVSANTIDYDEAKLFFHILASPQDPEEDLETAALYAPASFKIIGTNEGSTEIVWTVQAVKDGAEDEAAEEAKNGADTINSNFFEPVVLPSHTVIAVSRF